jgi:hypothetical protein
MGSELTVYRDSHVLALPDSIESSTEFALYTCPKHENCPDTYKRSKSSNSYLPCGVYQAYGCFVRTPRKNYPKAI